MVATAETAENKRVARRYPEEVATERDIDLIDEICSEDVIDHSPLGELRSRVKLKEQIKQLRTAFGDFSATVEDIVAEGDTVAMRVTVRGIHQGEFMGIEPTGREFEIQNMVFTRIEEGQIAERWVQPDMLGLMQQLGAVESPDAGNANKEVARRLIDEVFGEKNIDLIDELLAEDYVDHGRKQQGREPLKQHIKQLQTMASDHTASSDLQIADGDYVAIRWTANGTNDGPIGEAKPTGKPFEFTGVDLYRMEGGRLAESWYYWDSAQMVEQLGLGGHD